MVIKGNRLHQTNCFAEKIDYILSDKGRAKEVDGFELYQNIRLPSRDGAVEAFQKNDVYRSENAQKKKITRSVVCYHDILSFSHKDRSQINQEILLDLTEKYIQLRAPHAVVFAKPHLHNKNIHVHILISGSDYRSYQLTRLSDAKWNRVRKQIEKYQRQKYPQLKHSLVYDDIGKRKRKGKAKRLDNERQMMERLKELEGGQPKILDKVLMKNAILDFFKIARSQKEFFDLVVKHGIETYERTIRGKKQPYGVVCNGRKMRFSTIGVKKKLFDELDKRELTDKESQSILNKYVRYRINTPKTNKNKSRYRDRERDFD